MSVWLRLLGGLIGAVSGYLLTVIPGMWESYQRTPHPNAQTLYLWMLQCTPAAVVPMLVGIGVGQSLAARRINSGRE